MQSTIPLSRIIKGKNPRTEFNENDMESLLASVKAQGILQPILVRPHGNDYELVAGERRYRAALMAFGQDYEIPALIREMTDAEASEAALVENIQRSNMSPTEEAVAASEIVGRLNGDRDEAALCLGWSRTTLDKRLALMNCSTTVRTALNKREILLGHAELLAALAQTSQDKILPIIISEKKSVAELKNIIEQAASKLEAAIFDKKDCTGCQHNSSVQTSMFAECITEGSCTNPSCFKAKTDNALALLADSLKEEYPVIRIIRAGDNSTLVKLEADGEGGVGEAQATACRSCANFGAAISALPQAMGKVYKNRCFDPGCNANKVAARITAEKQSIESVATVESSTAKPIAEVKKVDVVSVAESDRIKAYREKVWRNAMKKEIMQSPALSSQYLIAICLNGSARHIDSNALGKAFKKLTGKDSQLSLDVNAKLVSEVTPEVLGTLSMLLAASAMEQIDVSYLRQLATYHKLDLTKYWALDKEFLDLLTKSEIEFIAKEIGLDKAIGDDFKKLFSEKKADLIEKLLSIKDVDFSAVIPSSIKY